MFKKGEWIIATRPLTFQAREVDRSWMDQPLEVKEVTEAHYFLAWHCRNREITFIMPFCEVENRGMIIANELLVNHVRTIV